MSCKHIYHASNMHIHSNKRFEEYNDIFDRLINILSNDRASVLIITGDILAEEDSITNESLKLLYKVLNMSSILPIIILQESDNIINTIVSENYKNRKIYFIKEISQVSNIIKTEYNFELSNNRYLVQQNYDTKFSDHGIDKINLQDNKSSFIHIPNDYGFCNIGITQNKINKLILPHNISIKFIVKDSDPEYINKVIAHMKSKYNVINHSIEYIDNNVINCKLAMAIDDEKKQTECINKYMKIKGYDKKSRIRMCKVHRQVCKTAKIHQSATRAPGIISLIELRFDNILCYGRDNVINFSKYNDNSVIALRGKNYAGKSSIFDIILFALFDKISRPGRENIMNIRTNTLCCKLIFKSGSNYYMIIRTGKRNAQGGVITGAQFAQIEYSPEGNNPVVIKNFTKKNKTKTNAIICDYVGSFSNYVSTSFVLHKNSDNILDETPMQQKKELCGLFQLDKFVPHHNKSKDIIKKETVNLHKLQMKNKKIDVKKEIHFLGLERQYHEINIARKKFSLQRHTCLEKYNIKHMTDLVYLIDNVKDQYERNHMLDLQYRMDWNESYDASKKCIDDIDEKILRLRELEKIKKEISDKKDEICLYERYRDLIHFNNIPFQLLKSKLPLIEKSMRNKLKIFGDDYDIKIIFNEILDNEDDNDDLKTQYVASKMKTTLFKLYMYRGGVLTNDISSGCGLERMIADIVFRLALDEVSNVSRLSMFVIDEELSYFDKEYLPKIGKLLGMIKKYYQYVMIISHNDQILEFVDHCIDLKRKELVNGFVNNIDQEAIPPDTINERKEIKKEDIGKCEKVIIL
jgi:hypothetical protein